MHRRLVLPLCLFCCLRKITLYGAGRTGFDLSASAEDCLAHVGKIGFDATRGSKGEGGGIRVGKTTKMLALLEVRGVKQGGGITGEHRRRGG